MLEGFLLLLEFGGEGRFEGLEFLLFLVGD